MSTSGSRVTVLSDNPFLRTTIFDSKLNPVGNFFGGFETILKSELHKFLYTLGDTKAFEFINLKNVEHITKRVPLGDIQADFDDLHKWVKIALAGKGENNAVFIFKTKDLSKSSSITILNENQESVFQISLNPWQSKVDTTTDYSNYKTYLRRLEPGPYFIHFSDSNYQCPITICQGEDHVTFLNVISDCLDGDELLSLNFNVDADLVDIHEDIMFTSLLARADALNWDVDHLLSIGEAFRYPKHSNAMVWWLAEVCYSLRKQPNVIRANRAVQKAITSLLKAKAYSPELIAICKWLQNQESLNIRFDEEHGIETSRDVIPTSWSAYKLLLETSVRGYVLSDTDLVNTLIPFSAKKITALQLRRLTFKKYITEDYFARLRFLIQERIYHAATRDVLEDLENRLSKNSLQKAVVEYLITIPLAIFKGIVTQASSEMNSEALRILASQLFRADEDFLQAFNLEIFTQSHPSVPRLSRFEVLSHRLAFDNKMDLKDIISLFWQEYNAKLSPQTLVHEFNLTFSALGHIMDEAYENIQSVMAEPVEIQEEDLAELFSHRQTELSVIEQQLQLEDHD